ncbi:hypothetical protein [Clostridium oceanicum]|uniref:Lipoprotein n=1 Tax=Clostridium oceanicum TaxID=1543 RepID=A0ABP3UR18_9CLOT
MRKKISILSALFFILLIFVGCSAETYTISKGSIEVCDSGITGAYGNFNGKYCKKVKFDKGDKIIFHIDIRSVKGKIKCELIYPDGKPFVELKDNKRVEISKEGEYKVQVDGKEHEGNFMVYWNNDI